MFDLIKHSNYFVDYEAREYMVLDSKKAPEEIYEQLYDDYELYQPYVLDVEDFEDWVNHEYTAMEILKCENFEPQLAILNPDLVIISLGTNDSYMPHFDSVAFASQLAKLISEVRTAQPDCAILLTSPGQNKIAGKTPNQNTFVATNFMLKTAQNQCCAIWNFNAIMESPEMTDVWYEAGLMRSDYLHFTRKGYELQAHLLFNALIQLKRDLQHINYQPNKTIKQ